MLDSSHVQAENEASINLVERILNGEQQAEADMVERYSRGLLFMLRRKAKNPDLANDVAQETWRIVIEKVRRHELKDPSKLAAFIVQTGKYQLLMSYRGKENDHVELGDEAGSQEDHHPQPQEVLEKHNTAIVVRRLLNELKTPRDREIMMRFYLKEQNKQVICQELGLNDLHFNRVLFRARQRFKQLWDEYAGADT